MVNDNIGIIEMYDIDTGIFNEPDANETYDWPTNDKKVTNWNTWMRAFAYCMRDYFDFTIDGGPGTSMGAIQYRHGDFPSDGYLPVGVGSDNDWTTSDGRLTINNNSWRDERRAGTPFRSGSSPWNSWTNNDNFDDSHNRFDIILSSSYYDNLGLRFKYPLTTTGMRACGDYIERNGNYYNYNVHYPTGLSNITILAPGMVPTHNKNQIAKLNNSYYSGITDEEVYGPNYLTVVMTDTNRYHLPYSGFISVLNNCRAYSYINQHWMGTNTLTDLDYGTTTFSYEGLDYEPNDVVDTYPWSLDFLNHVTNKNVLFENAHYPFNKIKYIKSYDNSTLLISIIDSNNNIMTQFCFYKKDNNKSSLIIAEDFKWNRNKAKTWVKKSITYGEMRHNTYGNMGNIILNSDNEYIVTPAKRLKDFRERTSIVGPEGLWRIEKFNDAISDNLAENFYLVTLPGTSTPIGAEGKFILGKENNKNIKFIVTTFNCANLGELLNSDSQFYDSSYLIAIPIEKEE